jgi:hypothetical protein
MSNRGAQRFNFNLRQDPVATKSFSSSIADAMLGRALSEHINSDNDAEMTAKVVRSRFAKSRNERALHRTRQFLEERLTRKQ